MESQSPATKRDLTDKLKNDLVKKDSGNIDIHWIRLFPPVLFLRTRVAGGQQAFPGVDGGNVDPGSVCSGVQGQIYLGESRSAFKRWSSQFFQHILKSLMDTLA